MARVQITLRENLHETVQDIAHKRGFETVSEYVRYLLQRDIDQFDQDQLRFNFTRAESSQDGLDRTVNEVMDSLQ